MKCSLSHLIQETVSIDLKCHLRAFTITTIQPQPFLFILSTQRIYQIRKTSNLTQEFLYERSLRGKSLMNVDVGVLFTSICSVLTRFLYSAIIKAKE